MADAPTACDLIVEAAWLLPIAPDNKAFTNAAMAIHDGLILAVGDAEEIKQAYRASDSIHFDTHIIMPGLVNAHGHAAMTLLRGSGEDQDLQTWLNDTIWPLEARAVNPDYVRLGTELAIAEMLASGTTTFSDMYFFPDVAGQVIDQCGIRAQLAFPVFEFPNAWSQGAEDGMHKGIEVARTYRHHPLINVALGPHAPYTVNAEHLSQVAMYANEMESQVHIHLHENQQEVDDARAQTGDTWVQLLDSLGLLGPHLQAVHMTTLDDRDFATIAASGTKVVHCPSSNAKLTSGYCDIEKLRAAGVSVGIGTDGAVSNNTLNMFAELRLASLLAKHENRDPTAGAAGDMLAMATLGGAEVLGIADQVGSLEPGKAADFICINTEALDLQPIHDPFASLVHGSPGHSVSDVYIAGQPRLRNTQFTSLDVAELRTRVSAWHQAFQQETP